MAAQNLLIIESPNKIETISHFLDKSFDIIATVGHIRDLSTKGGYGYDEKTLEPDWTIPRNNPLMKNAKPKKEIIAQIQKAAANSQHIFIATDPDREGEAIAWHVNEILSPADKKKVERVTFNEITEEAVKDALMHPRKIDLNWVKSQFSRRILDRMIGFKISKLLRNKHIGDSAGRVQTVALKFIYDREQEIKKFKEKKTYALNVFLEDDIPLKLREVNPALKGVKLIKTDTVDKTKTEFVDKESAEIVKKSLSKDYEVYAIDDPRKITIQAPLPFVTSSLLQYGISRLGWGASKVTSVAQSLYEGIKLNGKHQALISYPRSDAIRYADSFIAQAKKFILNEFGNKYLFVRDFSKLKKKGESNVQDGHESIRVINPTLKPHDLKGKISEDEYRLYSLIWVRTMASLMSPCQKESTLVRIVNNKTKFYTHSSKTIFDGFRKVYSFDKSDEEDALIPTMLLKVGKKLKSKKIEVKEVVTLPPPRYNQASLIKALEESGVGRPSTYSSMAKKPLERGYVVLESKVYKMTEVGNRVVEMVDDYFNDVINVDFTKNMEEHLDDIAHKDEKWKEWILEDIQPKVNKDVKVADKEIKRVEDEKTGKKCPECGAPLVYKYSKKTGKKFIACSNFPKCKHAESMPEDRPTILKEKCPLCGGNLLLRKGKRGNFIGCSNYPKCHFIKNEKDTNEQALEKMKAREVKMKAFAKAKEDKLAKKTVENEMHGVEKTKTKFK